MINLKRYANNNTDNTNKSNIINTNKSNTNKSNTNKSNIKSDNISSDIKSLHSIGSHEERKYDTLPFRIDFIKELLDGNKLDPLINFDSTATENFINPYKNDKNIDSDDSNNTHKSNNTYKSNNTQKSNETHYSNDTRFVLNKKMHNFYNIINQIGGKLLYVKSGSSGHTFKGMVSENDVNIFYAVKVVGYAKNDNYGDINDIRRPENAELMMIKALSYFVMKKQSPHIVLPIGTFNTSIKPFLNLMELDVIDDDNKKYAEFVERYKKGLLYDKVSVLISEWANRGDLLDFIRNNYKEFTLTHWKVFFFQIISVLAVIQSKYPAFRHNDLKANNILVHKVSRRRTLFSYRINKSKYIVPDIGYIIKLWDFDFACIPGVIENTKVTIDWTDKINVKPEQNRYYDMHYFFNTLIKKGFFEEFMIADCIPKEAKEFVNRIVPVELQRGDYVTKRGRIMINNEFLIPDDVLKFDPFFEEFRNNSHKKHKKSSQNSSQNSSLNSSQNSSKNMSHLTTAEKKYILSFN